MKLIDKDVVVAEIEKLELCTMDEHMNYYSAEAQGEYNALSKLESFIDTLEVKEVDLDFQRFAKEMDAIFALPSSETKNTEEEPLNWEYAIAKHFFELGMQVSNKAQKGE